MRVHGGTVPEEQYDFASLQEKWQPRWEQLRPFATEDPSDERPRKYVLDMFPYPSGDLHMGHAEAYAYGDVLARYWRHRGYNVLHPIGWDSFGLPAENAAIKNGIDPKAWTYSNIEQHKRSMHRYATAFDWERILHTSDPGYYKWNQWLFLELYKRGLAYRKDSPVNWCPKDQTVLANEQVVAGQCERCGTEVVKRKLTQWYFKITDYADRLLDDLDQLKGKWPDKVLRMQANWIGRSRGADVDFTIEGSDRTVPVFTTRPDTLFGVTFMAVAPDSDLAAELAAGSDAESRIRYQDYLTSTQKLTDIERQATDRTKTGVPLGRFAVNPITGDRVPIWAADYVLADYGHGAVMGVPGHDQRDLDFALQFGLEVKAVVQPVDEDPIDPAASGEAYVGDGAAVNSGVLDGLSGAEAVSAAIQLLEDRGTGRAATTYRLRDWLISRQRYWGTPIPILHREDGTMEPVPAEQLPVVLPEAEGLNLTPKGQSPLAAATSWVETTASDGTCAARRRHDGHLRRLLLVLPAVPVVEGRHPGVRPRRGAQVGADRRLRGRCRARDSAPALLALHHQGALRPRLRRLRRALHSTAQPGHGHSRRREDVEVEGQSGHAL